jgi:hypothetical protein
MICTYEYFMSTKDSFTVLIVAELETPPGCRGVFAGFMINTLRYGCLLVAWASSLTLYRLILSAMCILLPDVQDVIHHNSRSIPSIRTHWMSCTWHCTYLDAIVKVQFIHCYLVRCLSHSSASSASSLVNFLFLSQNLLISNYRIKVLVLVTARTLERYCPSTSNLPLFAVSLGLPASRYSTWKSSWKLALAAPTISLVNTIASFVSVG